MYTLVTLFPAAISVFHNPEQVRHSLLSWELVHSKREKRPVPNYYMVTYCNPLCWSLQKIIHTAQGDSQAFLHPENLGPGTFTTTELQKYSREASNTAPKNFYRLPYFQQ